MTYDVIMVADTILKIAKREHVSLTPMQLVKICFIAHGWSLGLRSKPLFLNKIEAWEYGPIIPDLYKATKTHGKQVIPLDKIGDVNKIDVESEDFNFMVKVFEKYGRLDGVTLSYDTHKAGSPWSQAYEPEKCSIIPDGLISDYYKKIARRFEESSRKNENNETDLSRVASNRCKY